MSQSLCQMYSHIVFSTKEHFKYITKSIQDELYAYMSKTIIEQGSILIKIGGHIEHMHILCTLPRTISISKLIENIKAPSSKWIKSKGEIWSKFAWQGGYGAFSISQSQLDVVSNYINNQEEHHKKVSFREELLQLLEKYNVKYDERYLWS